MIGLYGKLSSSPNCFTVNSFYCFLDRKGLVKKNEILKKARLDFSFKAWVNWAEFHSANSWINNICHLLWQIIPAPLEGTTGNCNSSPSSLYFSSCTFSFYKILECKLWECGVELHELKPHLSAAYMPFPLFGFTCVFCHHFNFCTASPADQKAETQSITGHYSLPFRKPAFFPCRIYRTMLLLTYRPLKVSESTMTAQT